MGAWGTGLYQDDTTDDIREEYLNYLRIGLTNEEATNKVLEENDWWEEDKEEGSLLWFALADTQWKYGRLMDKVKKQALKYIEEGTDLERWEEDKKLYKKRKEVLEKLKEKLNSPMPEEKKVGKLKMLRSPWKDGDILLYQILDEDLKDHKYYKKYVILKVFKISKSKIGTLPIEQYYDESNVVALYNWVGDKKIEKSFLKNLKPIVMQEDNMPSYGIYRLYEMDFDIYSRNELKMLNIEVLLNDKDEIYLKNPPKRNVPMRGIRTVYTMDYTIKDALEIAKNEGKLFEDFNQKL